jgi:hypothetical protein
MVSAPLADFTWRHARRLAGPDATQADIARVLDALLTRAQHGPDRAGARVAARTRAGQRTHRPPTDEAATPPQAAAPGQPATTTVVRFGVFDVDAEAERWI